MVGVISYPRDAIIIHDLLVVNLRVSPAHTKY